MNLEQPLSTDLRAADLGLLLDKTGKAWFDEWALHLRNELDLAAVMVLAIRSGGIEQVLALSPERSHLTPLLQEAAEAALEEGHSVIAPDKDSPRFVAALPVRVDDEVLAITAVVLPILSKAELDDALQRLTWLSGWLELQLLRARDADNRQTLETQRRLVDGYTAVAAEPLFKVAAAETVNYLTREFDCERVVLGYLDGDRLTIQCQSDSSEYQKKLQLMQLTREAMQEAADQLDTVAWPVTGGQVSVSTHHLALSEALRHAALFSIPLLEREHCYGVLLLQRPQDHPFSAMEQRHIQALAQLLGAALEDKRQAQLPLHRLAVNQLKVQLERLLAPGHLIRKLSAIALFVLVLFFSFASGQYRLAGDAVVEGDEVRGITAPFDGFILESSVRAGNEVQLGQPLARLDDRELYLERAKWISELAQNQRQFEDALAQNEAAQSQILKTRIDRAKAEIALLDYQLSQARFAAPFDGIVVSGDLSQRIGTAVRQGEVLFEIAPEARYRLVLFVDEYRLKDVAPGQQGQLVVSALPERAFDFEVTQVLPRAEVRDGATVYRVEAAFSGDQAPLRPGLEGVAKIDVDERLLIAIWTRGLRDWLSMQWWRFWG